jgi:hypothetical protein
MEDGTSSGETTHDLLLALAGRVDDDLLGRARELVAVGEDARAVELVTASLVACRAVLPEQVRSALVAAGRAARTDLNPGAVLPEARSEDGTEHRFTAPADDDPVAGVLLTLPARSLAGCSVLLTRRNTPAGSAPGPAPHPVVLVEAPADGRPAEVLAYQIAAALERAGVHASVEVLTAGVAPSAYHAAALRNSVPVIAADEPQPALAERPRPAPRRAPARRPEPEPEPEPQAPPEPQPSVRRGPLDTAGLLGPPVHSDGLLGALLPSRRLERREPERQEHTRPEPERREPVASAPEPDDTGQARPMDGADDPATTSSMPASPVAPTPTPSGRADLSHEQSAPAAEQPPAPRPAPRPIPTPTGRIRRPTVTPISRTSVPNPIPLGRRSGPVPIVRPLTPVEPEAEPPVEDAVEDVAEAPAQEAAPHREWRRRAEAQTPAFNSLSDPLSGPLNEPLLAPVLDPTIHEDDPLGVAGRPPADDRPRPARASDDDWSADWLSGTWAMAPSALDGPARDREDARRPDVAEEIHDEVQDEGSDEVQDEIQDEAQDEVQVELPDEDVPVAEPEPPAPRPAPRRPARHRYADESGPPAAPPQPAAGEPERDQPQPEPEPEPEAEARPEPEPDSSALGLRPESLARLSDADRQLLARLQAELLEGRKPRVGRRAGIGNGVGPHGNNGAGTNGSHRSDPPDLAG